MIKRSLQALIKIYTALISPAIGPSCRFHPTCSCYAREALEHHRTSYALWLIVRRISRCHPLYKGEFYDPVPPGALTKSGTNPPAMRESD